MVRDTIKRPTALVVVAWLFMVSGIVAAVSMTVTPLAGGGVHLDVDMIGLWIGKAACRELATS